jgi:hypothetical protein
LARLIDLVCLVVREVNGVECRLLYDRMRGGFDGHENFFEGPRVNSMPVKGTSTLLRIVVTAALGYGSRREASTTGQAVSRMANGRSRAEN